MRDGWKDFESLICVDEKKEAEEEANQPLLKALCTDTSAPSPILFCGSGTKGVSVDVFVEQWVCLILLEFPLKIKRATDHTYLYISQQMNCYTK